MKYLALLAVFILCTHCTEGRSPSPAGKTGSADSRVTVAQEQNKAGPTTSSQSAMQQVYIDPDTGELVTSPEGDVRAAGASTVPSALSTSVEGLEEETSPVPGGGMMIDLKGHFNKPLSATVEDSGKPKIEHQTRDRME